MRNAVRITAATLAALIIWAGASALADGDDATAAGTVLSEQSSDTGTSPEFQWKRSHGLNVR